jgi:hypothetical protein
MVGLPQPSGFQRSESNARVLNNKLSLLFGMLGQELVKFLMKKINSLFHFDNTWGARHVICLEDG